MIRSDVKALTKNITFFGQIEENRSIDAGISNNTVAALTFHSVR